MPYYICALINTLRGKDIRLSSVETQREINLNVISNDLEHRKMSIKNWPEMERPREKLLKNGASSLSDAELLAVFLQTGFQKTNAVELGRELLKNFTNLSGFIRADFSSLIKIKGLGKAKITMVLAILEINKRLLKEQIEQKDTEGLKRFIQIRNKLIHTGRFPDEQAIDEAGLFVRITERVLAQILGLTPKDVLGSLPAFQASLSGE